MLGIDCMKHKIPMVVFVAFFFAPLALLVWDMLQGGEGRGGGGGVKVSGKGCFKVAHF